MLIRLKSKSHHKTTPSFLIFKKLFMIKFSILLNKKFGSTVHVSVVWLKKQIYHTSSESSWNSILPLGVWLVSNGSSITSPAEFSSTCCCSTEYLCTKNLPAHSKSNQIIKKIVACRQAEYTCAQIHSPATTDIFLDKHNSCNDAQQHDNNDRYHNGHCFRVGFFYLWKQKNKTNLQQVKK